METGILHTHILLTTTFLLFFVFKTVLLFVGAKDLLDKVRKYKMIDMIWGTLIIITGGLLWYLTYDMYGHRMWLDVKALLVLVAIGLGIVSMKKENKMMALLVCLILVYVYGVAETKGLNFKPETNREKVEQKVDKIKGNLNLK